MTVEDSQIQNQMQCTIDDCATDYQAISLHRNRMTHTFDAGISGMPHIHDLIYVELIYNRKKTDSWSVTEADRCDFEY
jgi:hypothetical protein